MADITFDQMKELFEQFFGATKASQELKALEAKAIEEQKNLFDSLRKLSKEIDQNIKTLKKSHATSTSFENMLKGNTAKIETNIEAYDKLKEAIANASKITNESARKEEVAALKKQKRALMEAQISNAFGASLHNLKLSTLTVADSLIKGAFDFVKGLQSGQGGVELATNTALKGIDTTKKLVDDVGSMAGTLAAALAVLGTALPIGRLAKAVGSVASVLGIGAIAASKGLEYTAKATEYLGEELKKTEAAYKMFTDTGAQFAGGMTELRAQAANAGLDVTQFATIVKNTTGDLSSMGLGIGEASKRIGNVSKELRTTNLGIQLRKLGFGAEEQAELGAQVAANLAASGRLRVTSDREVAGMTLQYGKDLKVLQAITGEDAKKKMEEAKLKTMEADLLAEAMRTGGPDAVLKLQRQLAAMPEGLKKGYMEFVSSGGQTVLDAATNVAITQIPGIMDMFRAQYVTLGDVSKNATYAQDQTTKLTENIAIFARDNAENLKVYGQAARFGGEGLVKSVSDLNNSIILTGLKFGEGVTDQARKAAEASANNLKPLDENIARLNENTHALRAALGAETTGAITGFANTLRAGIDTVDSALKKIGLKAGGGTETKGEKMGGAVGGAVGGYAGMTAGAALGAGIGSAFAGIGAVPGAIIGGVLGGLGVGMLGSWAGAGVGKDIEKWSSPTVPGAATGGILSGAKEGFPAILHGTEAVVPLPDGKTIPVTVDTSALSATTLNPINNMSAQLQQLSTAMLNFISKTAEGKEISVPNLTELKGVITELNDTARAQLEKHDQMIRTMQEHKDVSERMLNNSY